MDCGNHGSVYRGNQGNQVFISGNQGNQVSISGNQGNQVSIFSSAC